MPQDPLSRPLQRAVAPGPREPAPPRGERAAVRGPAGQVPALLAVALAALAQSPGCSMQDTDVRHYQAPKEASPKAAAAPRAAGAAASAASAKPAQAKLIWSLPEGWSQSEGPRSMRLATFQALAPPKSGGDEAAVKAECTLIALPGTAGGVAANVNRWRRQVGLPPQDPAAIDAAGTRIDTGLGQARSWQLLNADGPESMIAALIPPGPHGDTTYFVKLKAPTASVPAYAEGFRAFVASLRAEGSGAAAKPAAAKPAAAKPAVAKPAAAAKPQDTP